MSAELLLLLLLLVLVLLMTTMSLMASQLIVIVSIWTVPMSISIVDSFLFAAAAAVADVVYYDRN